MTLHTSLSAPKVTIHNGKGVTTSLDVADYFHKLHKNVIRSIEALDCSPEFNRLNFEPVDYVDAKGEKRPMYTMTKDGFVFLVMGFTGKKAAAFKEAYIAEFNRMEAELYAIPKYKPQAAELFNDDDTRCLTHLVWSMANGFHFDRAWTQAIWYALRRVTGTPLSTLKSGNSPYWPRSVAAFTPLPTSLKRPSSTPRNRPYAASCVIVKMKLSC